MALELQHTRVATSDSNKSLTSPSEVVKRPSHLELPKGLNIQSLQKRPSIAPVPAFLEANDIRIQLNSDVETDEEEEIPSMDSDDAGSEYDWYLIILEERDWWIVAWIFHVHLYLDKLHVYICSKSYTYTCIYMYMWNEILKFVTPKVQHRK